MPHETGRVIRGCRSEVAPQADDIGPERGEERHDGGPAPLQAAWCADAEERAHDEPQIEFPAWISNRVRMFVWPRRWVRRMPLTIQPSATSSSKVATTCQPLYAERPCQGPRTG
jgi:hypothetical protein